MSSTTTTDTSKPVEQVYEFPKAPVSLSVIVVGGGIGGLAAALAIAQGGHQVTLLESATAFTRVGAGIQISPNLSRLLIKWGLKDVLNNVGVEPEGVVLRRYSTGEIVGRTVWSNMEELYGSPYYHVHRADLHQMLHDLVVNSRSPTIEIKLASTVVEVGVDGDPTAHGAAWAKLQTGEVLRADLIVATDGVKSAIREFIAPNTKATPTGDAAYRAVISTSHLLADPELRSFVDHPEATAWMAPGRHLIAYCVAARKEFNLVLIHPDDGSVESWTAEGSAEKMRHDFREFEPRVQKILSFVSSTLKWKLMDRDPLTTWIHPQGHIVLLGDACHPMLPYRAQGAAMAVEDAVVLGTLLSNIRHLSQLLPILEAYQRLRLQRTAMTQLSSRMNQKIFHLPDGPEQQKRDDGMRAAMLAEQRLRDGLVPEGDDSSAGSQNQWADKKKSEEQFGYNAFKVAQEWWDEFGHAVPVDLKSIPV